MNKENFIRALEIISKHHSSKLTINQPINNFVGDLGKDRWTIHIQSCCPSVIEDLLSAGYLLDLSELGLSVTKI